MEAAVIATYRCMHKCSMCHTWKHPTRREEEFLPSLLEKLPGLSFCNLTGGEPFMREDIDDIVTVLEKKAGRLVISTNGYLTQKIVDLAKKHRRIGFRISLEGLSMTNDELRGMPGSFDHGLRSVLELRRMGIRDIGFAVTVSDRNAGDMLELYHLARAMKVEFATAVVHNSYYFHTCDNVFENTADIISSFEKLIQDLLRTWRIKNWARAYFNQGLINYVGGGERLLPCAAGTDTFFLDPWGEIKPCNGMEEQFWHESLGNLHDHSFSEIWSSQKADRIRELVKGCPKDCWMIGSAGPAIKRNVWRPALWALKNKLKTLFS